MDPAPISVTPPLAHLKISSMASDASITGDFVTLDKRGKIRQWIEDIDMIDSFNSRASVAGMELHSVISSEDSRYGRNAGSSTVVGSDIDAPLDKDVAGLDPLLDDDFDADDDFFVEAAQSALEKGKTSFNANDFAAADAYLREALAMIKELAKKQQSICDTWELRRMLGVCAFHVHTALEAEQALVSVLENAPKNAILNEVQRLHVSETAHLLAQIYVTLGKLDKAYRYCEYALRGRRKILGKNHEQSYDSLALTARILELQNNSIRGGVYIGMIPEAERDAYLRKFADLSLPDGPSISTTEVLPTDAASSVSEQVSNRNAGEVPIASASKLKISERPVSGGSISPPPSTVSALRQDEIARPVSALSRQVSATSSEVVDMGAVSSVSPPNSPLPVATGSAMGVSPPQQHRSGFQQLLQPHVVPGRPDQSGSRSHSGSFGQSSLPDISEPSSPAGLHEQLKLFPRPLRTQPQRQTFLSELPGDSHYKQISNPAMRSAPVKDERPSAPRLPPAPRSVPLEAHATNYAPVPMHLTQQSPVANDRDRLPSQAAQAPKAAEPPTEPLPVSIEPERSENEPQISQPVQPLDRMQSQVDPVSDSRSLSAPPAYSPLPPQLETIDPTPPNAQISSVASPAVQPFVTSQAESSRLASGDVAEHPQPIVPDAQRSDFVQSKWTPPIQSYRAVDQRYAPSTDDLAARPPAQPLAPPPAPPAATIPNVERWAGQYIGPSNSQSADRQSIASSNYSESLSTIQSMPPSYQALPSAATNHSQESSKSKRKPSLLKVFRNSSSPATAADRTSIISYDGVRLSRADTDSIKHEALTDAAIDFWQEYLENDILHRSSKFVLMRPVRAALLQESSYDPANLKAALPDITPGGETLHIFIPLQNPRNANCSLLLISPQDGVACHYDPYQPRNRKLAEGLSSRIASHLGDAMPLVFYDVADTPAVLHAKDSAVFVCMFMQHLVLKLQHTPVGQKIDASLKCRVDAKSARKTMAKVVEARKKGEKILWE